MRIKKEFFLQKKPEFTQKALIWAQSKRNFCYLNGNDCPYAYGSFPEILAVGNLKEIALQNSSPYEDLANAFNAKDWMFGFIGYDLNSKNSNHTVFQKGFFFLPETIVKFIGDKSVEIESIFSPDEILETILQETIPEYPIKSSIAFKARLNKEEYIKTIETLKQHLNRGDIYQINFCIDFEAINATFDPVEFYQKLNRQSPMPFSGLLKMQDRYIVCASPERYLKRIGSKIVSQPMKGTAPRDADALIDQNNLLELQKSTKERAENIMIVDLVRNDLSRFCKSGTVKVENLCDVYSFYPVHQMVSTVIGTAEDDLPSEEIIRNSFPMGSMTGAPKIRAMELIEQYEVAPRGAFSGAMGYLEPNGNFDFNVLIRSVFYDAKAQTISYSVGSGITSLSDPEKEYEECMLKASSIHRVLSN